MASGVTLTLPGRPGRLLFMSACVRAVRTVHLHYRPANVPRTTGGTPPPPSSGKEGRKTSLMRETDNNLRFITACAYCCCHGQWGERGTDYQGPKGRAGWSWKALNLVLLPWLLLPILIIIIMILIIIIIIIIISDLLKREHMHCYALKPMVTMGNVKGFTSVRFQHNCNLSNNSTFVRSCTTNCNWRH